MAGEFVATIAPSGAGFSNNHIASNANIDATKLNHQRMFSIELAEQNTAVVAAQRLIGPINGESGVWKSFEAAIVVQATGGDRTVTIDLHRSTGGAAFATVMTTTINITNSTTILVPVAGVFSNSAIADGDVFKIVVTVAGAAGAQAKGLVVNLIGDFRAVA